MLAAFLRRIYDGFDTSADFEPAMWREILRVVNEAAVEGLSQGTAPPSLSADRDFYRALRHSNEVFSAFKVHRMGREMAALLTDTDGRLKPFSKWVEDVRGISTHYNRTWLGTEYSTAVIRAHNAADWRQFERDKDILPNLRWMPTTSPDPEGSHRAFWERKLTLPVDDGFWNRHHPGDRWNCKCTLEQTDDPATPELKELLDGDRPQPGLGNNPGKDGHLFSQDHPYFPESCSSCAFYRPDVKDRILGFFNARKKDCYNCPYINACISRMSSDGFKLEHKAENGGSLYIHQDVEKDKTDYKDMKRICLQFAKTGHEVRMTPRLHYRSEEYKKIYGSLTGTKFEKKCPDFSVDGVFYEYEGFAKPWNKKKIRNMISHGLKQSDRIVINNTKGCSDRYLRKAIVARLRFPEIKVSEVWVYEKVMSGYSTRIENSITIKITTGESFRIPLRGDVP